MLCLDDGTVIEISGRPAQGTRHCVVFGRHVGSGEKVVVKVELVGGSLETERLALEWIGGHGGPVPGVRAASRVACPDGRHPRCLVTDRVDGVVPESADGWRRLGRELAGLADLPWEGSSMTVIDADMLGAAHVTRIRDLADPIREATIDIPDRDHLLAPSAHGGSPLVITHGDPGPGNFLDDGVRGTLVDWEEAHVAPRGLDLARTIFIAALGVGPAGFIGRDAASRSRSVTAGYLEGLGGSWQPTREELRWWVTVAGIQLAHRRWEREGRPGVLPAVDAINVLASALRDDHSWMPG